MTDSPKTLDAERWRRLADIVEALVELEPEYRSAYLSVLARQDAALQRDALRVLALFDPSAGEVTSDGDPPAELTPAEGFVGRRIGPYRVAERLGAGGMGEVYLAERDDDEYRRQVAIKVIRGGAEHPWTHRRFRRERQILASLVHPNIARMYDAGTTAGGLPYLVMEWVDGEPITDYCRRHALPIEERLDLLRQVCSAVELAHQRFVLHRDLKPSNILVTAEGEPKLLDFGIARLFDPAADDATATLGPVGLTLAYASPEQVAGESTDTSSDVYSLGVVAYELLTGRNPHRVAGGRSGAEATPVTPWDRLRGPSRPAAPASTALAGSTVEDHGWDTAEAERASRVLAGDLENVVAKALRVEPEHRYATIDRFAEDLRFFVEGRPVSASGDALSYRLRKFVERHRVAVAAAIALVTVLVAFAAVSTYQARVVASERDRAEAALAEVTTERDRNRQISEFLVDTFDIVDRDSAAGRSLTAKQLIDDAVERLAGLDADPEVQVRLLRASSEIYESLGQMDQAAEVVSRAVDLAEAELGPDHEETLGALISAGDLYFLMGDSPRAEALHSVVIDRAARSRPADDPLPLLSLATVCKIRLYASRAAAARDVCRRIEGILDADPAIALDLRLEALQSLSFWAQLDGESELAERVLQRGRIAARDDPGPVRYVSVLAELYYAEFLLLEDRFADAVPVLRQAVDLVRQAQDRPLHGEAVALRRLGQVLLLDDQAEEAIAKLNDSVRLLGQIIEQRPEVGRHVMRLGVTRVLLGDAHEAAGRDPRPQYELALEALLDPRVTPRADVLSQRAYCLAKLGRAEEALDVVADAKALGWNSRRLQETEALARGALSGRSEGSS